MINLEKPTFMIASWMFNENENNGACVKTSPSTDWKIKRQVLTFFELQLAKETQF